jgi:hypothetical protein
MRRRRRVSVMLLVLIILLPTLMPLVLERAVRG